MHTNTSKKILFCPESKKVLQSRHFKSNDKPTKLLQMAAKDVYVLLVKQCNYSSTEELEHLSDPPPTGLSHVV